MDLSQILAAVYEDTNYQSSPAAAVTTRLTRYVNEGYRAIIAEPGMSRLVDTDQPFTFSTTADQSRYVLPEAYTEIRHLTERDNDRSLRYMSLSDYRRMEPDPSASTGLPDFWIPFGRTAVATQPSDASEIFVDSTSASDTNTAYLEGIITGGYTRTASVTMTGTTAVTLDSGITTWIEITDFYLDAAAVGTVTLHEDASGGTELARITIGKQRPRYQGFYLWPTPEDSITYYVDARREITELSVADDEPLLPTDFHPMLAKYAAFREWEHKDDLNRASVARAQYEKWLSRLKYHLMSQGDMALPSGLRRPVGRSRLGGWYPADRWVG